MKLGEQKQRQAKVRWCSWLSRQSNTLKVSSSNLDRISLCFCWVMRFGFVMLPFCLDLFGPCRGGTGGALLAGTRQHAEKHQLLRGKEIKNRQPENNKQET